jgi:hypothetical protein
MSTIPETSDDSFWISEARLQELCRIKRATWRAWADQELIASDDGGAYSEPDALSVVLILALRDHLSSQDTALAWQAVRSKNLDREMLAAISDKGRLDLIIEPETRVVRYATDDASLARAVRFGDDPRSVIVVPVEGKLRRVREGFEVLRAAAQRPVERRLGRPPKIVSRPVSTRKNVA